MQRRSSAAALLAAGLLFVTAGRADQRDCCAVLELRQYTLKPGQRDALIELFDRHFVETQEATGMTIVGQFRDRRRADRFVWVRGFSDMQTRHAALERFYGGPVWKQHSAAANVTMVDVSDVLLLKPATPDTSFHVDPNNRPTPGEKRERAAVLAGIHSLRAPADAALISRFQQQVVPALRRNGVAVESIFITEAAPNTFTRLPVREGEQVLVWFGTPQQGEALTAQRLQEASAALNADAKAPPQLLELEPTPRSLLGSGVRPR